MKAVIVIVLMIVGTGCSPAPLSDAQVLAIAETCKNSNYSVEVVNTSSASIARCVEDLER